MKVLLVSANQLKPTATLPWVPVEPLGMAYVAASLRVSGHDIEFLDLCFSPDWEADLRTVIGVFQPACIGISLRNIDLMAYFNPLSFVDDLRAIVDVCRGCTSVPIVLGGSGFSVMPRELLRFTGLDLGIAGEGEWSFPLLLERLEGGADCSGIPGVVSRVDTNALGSAPAWNAPPPLRHIRPERGLIDGTRYRAAGGAASLQTKRGCPFACIYCTYPLVEGTVMRCRPPEEVAGEFRELSERYGINEAYVVDNQFNYPLEHAQEICERLARDRADYKVWWSCMLNPAYVPDDFAILLRLVRCARVDLSIESASDRMLERLGKNFTARDVRHAIEALKKAELGFNTWVLFGGPGESEETIRETLDALDEMGVSDVLVGVGLRICPGTRIERIARDEGRIDDRTDLVRPVFYVSMDAEKIVKLVEPSLARHPGWRIAALKRPSD
jgi:radical SAM superfamily enzyme YgiQ (UPF0313 family)